MAPAVQGNPRASIATANPGLPSVWTGSGPETWPTPAKKPGEATGVARGAVRVASVAGLPGWTARPPTSRERRLER